MRKYHKVAKKSKKLRSHMILVYESHIKNSSDFDKELPNIACKDIYIAHIVLCSYWDMFLVVKDV
jgi:hypothetical protein